jgi:hypothetical protein
VETLFPILALINSISGFIKLPKVHLGTILTGPNLLPQPILAFVSPLKIVFSVYGCMGEADWCAAGKVLLKKISSFLFERRFAKQTKPIMKLRRYLSLSRTTSFLEGKYAILQRTTRYRTCGIITLHILRGKYMNLKYVHAFRKRHYHTLLHEHAFLSQASGCKLDPATVFVSISSCFLHCLHERS